MHITSLTVLVLVHQMLDASLWYTCFVSCNGDGDVDRLQHQTVSLLQMNATPLRVKEVRMQDQSATRRPELATHAGHTVELNRLASSESEEAKSLMKDPSGTVIDPSDIPVAQGLGPGAVKTGSSSLRSGWEFMEEKNKSTNAALNQWLGQDKTCDAVLNRFSTFVLGVVILLAACLVYLLAAEQGSVDSSLSISAIAVYASILILGKSVSHCAACPWSTHLT